jgi:cysteine-rich repeat protein
MSRFACLCTVALSLGLCGCGSDSPDDSNNNNDPQVPLCGDGQLDLGEVCDEGELNSDTEPDGCRTDCRHHYCGDGVTDLDEACDEGGANSDRLANACRTNCVLPTCGDGVVDGDERCDDGNSEPGDGCSTDCDLETNWECNGFPSICQCQPHFIGSHCGICVAYVDQSADTQAADGLSWESAFADIQLAVDTVAALDKRCEVWVAQGNYHQYRTNRGDSLRLRTNVSLYGGFAGDETMRSERDPAAHPTVVLGTSTDGQHQVFHVITAHSVVDATVSGVTVTGGRADGDPNFGDDRGGAVQSISSAGIFDQVLFDDNVGIDGGAVHVYSSNLRFQHCRFENNEGLRNGGALFVSRSDVWVADSAVVNNKACDLADLNGVGGGGGIYVEKGFCHVLRSTFLKNNARSWTRGGGAILVDYLGVLELDDSLLLSNNATFEGGGIQAHNGGAVTIHNSVLAANTTNGLGKPTAISADGLNQGMMIAPSIVRVKRSWLLNHNGSLVRALELANMEVTSSVLAGNGGTDPLLLNHDSFNFSLGNCTIVGNAGPTLASFDGSLSMVNSIVWDNVGAMSSAGQQVTHCDVQLPNPTSPTNFSNDPGFRGGLGAAAYTGTADISIDPDTYEIILHDTAATHSSGALVGLAVLVDGYWFAIRSNSATEIRGWGGNGNVNYPVSGTYQIIDLRLGTGSTCLDVGDDTTTTGDGSDILEIPWSDDPGGNTGTVTDLGAYAGAP